MLKLGEKVMRSRHGNGTSPTAYSSLSLSLCIYDENFLPVGKALKTCYK